MHMSHPPKATDNPAKIYLLPNLMTAGNLIFGFLAVLKIVEGSIHQAQGGSDWASFYIISIRCILAACLFDLLDGRLARLGGQESPFGREFDSLADIVSFGVAPALLMFKIVLYEIPHQIGWIIAGIYLLFGALRLARFNIVSAYNLGGATRNFTGFPIPAAAGVISSITLLVLSQYQHEQDLAAAEVSHRRGPPEPEYLLPELDAGGNVCLLSSLRFSAPLPVPSLAQGDRGGRRRRSPGGGTEVAGLGRLVAFRPWPPDADKKSWSPFASIQQIIKL
jgi:CDP-diacylglycerol--serine O-phosphatidyltransferase